MCLLVFLHLFPGRLSAVVRLVFLDQRDMVFVPQFRISLFVLLLNFAGGLPVVGFHELFGFLRQERG